MLNSLYIYNFLIPLIPGFNAKPLRPPNSRLRSSRWKGGDAPGGKGSMLSLLLNSQTCGGVLLLCMVVSLCHCNFNVISIYKVLPFIPGGPGDATKSKNMVAFVFCFL